MTERISELSALLKPSAVGGLALLRSRAAAEPDRPWDSVLKIVAASYEGQSFDLKAASRLHELLPRQLVGHPEVYRGAIRVAADLLPPWIDLLCDGREALQYLDPNLAVCFERAGALAPIPSPAVIRWWNGLVELAYRNRGSGNIEIGRQGERLSLNREHRLLSGCPHPTIAWTALDTNTAGYDIHSWRRNQEEWTPKLIEVKTITRAPSPIYLTRHEWDTSRRMAAAYCFQVWDLRSERMAELTSDQMSSHIPPDCGLGRWSELKITLPIDMFVPA